MSPFRTALLAVLAAATVFAAAPAHAQSWNAYHPRRAEVNGRLARQNARITAGVRDGQMSRGEAQQLRNNDRGMRAQERQDAAADNGHITRGEQRQLNVEENANSRNIYGERHP